MNCIICQKEIKELYPEFEETDISKKNWDLGTGFTICCGYGSALDGDMFEGVICDTCLSKLKANHQLKIVGNYITGEKGEG